MKSDHTKHQTSKGKQSKSIKSPSTVRGVAAIDTTPTHSMSMKPKSKQAALIPTSNEGSRDSAPKSKNPPEIISLLEIEEKQVREAMKRSLLDAFSSTNKGKQSANKKQKQNPEIISILSDSEDDGGGKMSRCSSSSTINLLDSETTKFGKKSSSSEDDDEIMVVDKEDALGSLAFQSAAKAATSSGDGNADDDDEIMEMGTKNAMDLV